MKALNVALAAALLSANISATAGATALSAEQRAAADARKAAEADEVKRLGSLYVRCDGQPDNMPGMETFGRVVALSLVVGLLLPSPESAHPAKRLFADKGVDACTRLVDGPDRREPNGLRRIPLILARALHRIEAKDYTGAITDVGLARGEARTLGLVGNPYFERSMGFSFNLIEAEAELRANNPQAARAIGTAQIAASPFSFYAAVTGRTYSEFNRDLSPAEEAHLRAAQQVSTGIMARYASRLDEVGRFADSARQRDMLVTVLDGLTTNSRDAATLAAAGIAHALAGHTAEAAKAAETAQATMDKQAAAGKPPADAASAVELLDFYGVVKLANEGRLDEARRNFAARSQWLAPSLGSVMAMNARLRVGARPDQLFGALATTPDQLWTKRRALLLAKRLEEDTDNRTLFSYILPYAKISEFEAVSKTVWRTDKSAILARQPLADSRYQLMTVSAAGMVQPDALLLHAALLAQARGKQGFVMVHLANRPQTAYVAFGNPGEPDMVAGLYLDAAAVIAELRKIIPSPEDLAARRKAART